MVVSSFIVDAGFRGVSARCDTRGIDAPASLIKMLIDEGGIPFSFNNLASRSGSMACAALLIASTLTRQTKSAAARKIIGCFFIVTRVLLFSRKPPCSGWSAIGTACYNLNRRIVIVRNPDLTSQHGTKEHIQSCFP